MKQKPASDSSEYPLGQPMPGTKWVLHGKLGHGGMGIVLDVVKARLIPGAMKVLHPSFARIPEFAERFLEEVKVTAQLQHPNIVQVLDFDRLADGTPFMVMERLRGRTLRAALRETKQRGKTWTPANTYAVAAQVCEGLSRAHLHPRAIVHRDIKPENIYLHRPDGSLDSVVKVMDFGVAAIVGQRDRNQIGTPRYMAPEQLRGDRVSPQTDQYALALVIYEMLTGRLPWDVDVRDVSAIAKVHLSVPPAPTSTFCAWLPQRVDAAILKALSKDPRARHESVHGLLFELRGLQRLDRSSDTTTDAHSTDPMVGTLADGYAVVREDPETVGHISRLLEDQIASIPDLGSSAGVDVHLSQASIEAGAQGLGRSSAGDVQPRYATSHGSDALSPHSSEQVAAPYNARASAVDASSRGAETPMTAESAAGLHHAAHGNSPRFLRLRRVRVGTIIAVCGVAALVGAVTNARRLRREDRPPPIETTRSVPPTIDAADVQALAVPGPAESPSEFGSGIARGHGDAGAGAQAQAQVEGAPSSSPRPLSQTRTLPGSAEKGTSPRNITASAPAFVPGRPTSTPSNPAHLKPHYEQF
jgi:serine/threonine protein kinase